MKQKKFKIEGTTLFVYRPQMHLNSKVGRGTTTTPSDPSVTTATTTVSTGYFQR